MTHTEFAEKHAPLHRVASHEEGRVAPKSAALRPASSTERHTPRAAAMFPFVARHVARAGEGLLVRIEGRPATYGPDPVQTCPNRRPKKR